MTTLTDQVKAMQQRLEAGRRALEAERSEAQQRAHAEQRQALERWVEPRRQRAEALRPKAGG
jgi:hypothetical protein